ncbi:hypothetical protein FOCC_FOCC016221, partial [Frankliniella occidentalis]
MFSGRPAFIRSGPGHAVDTARRVPGIQPWQWVELVSLPADTAQPAEPVLLAAGIVGTAQRAPDSGIGKQAALVSLPVGIADIAQREPVDNRLGLLHFLLVRMDLGVLLVLHLGRLVLHLGDWYQRLDLLDLLL